MARIYGNFRAYLIVMLNLCRNLGQIGVGRKLGQLPGHHAPVYDPKPAKPRAIPTNSTSASSNRSGSAEELRD
jgi:hypothetical protein